MDRSAIIPLPPRSAVLRRYFFLSYLAVLVNAAGYLREISFAGPLTAAFAVAALLAYGLIYLLPAALPVLALDWLLDRPRVWRAMPDGVRAVSGAVLMVLALLSVSTVQVFIFADRFIFNLYNYHINGFVWNLVFTRGGIESLGGGTSTSLAFGLVVGGIVAVQALLLGAAALGQRREWLRRWMAMPRWGVVTLVLLVVAAGVFEQVAYGVSSIRNYSPVLVAAEAFPCYMPTTFRRFAAMLGVKLDRDRSFHMNVDTENITLHYPLRPLVRSPDAISYNIVWLAVESLRGDTVDPNIMPHIYDFAQRSNWFRNHYSGGNGTRMGMFSMFYGLYGSYWFPFLDQKRGPVLMDLILHNDYQVDLRTSAEFTYPEFDKTIFAAVPSEKLHEAERGDSGWEKDRRNVASLLEFIDKRDTHRPFMAFMFFESPHSRYYFPPEDAVHTPYLDDFNYATMDLHRDMPLIKNRYLNSCHHFDSQVQRIIAYLDNHHLLDSTIVIITGDHGEEFMEKGRWGHGSAFTEEQTKPALIMHAPGKEPSQVTRMTSHLDIPVTVLTLLGVTNPPRDYSLGFDLYGKETRPYTVLADWNNLAYVDDQYKAVFPFKTYSLTRQVVTTRDDAAVEDKRGFFQGHQATLLQIMKEASEFRGGKGAGAAR